MRYGLVIMSCIAAVANQSVAQAQAFPGEQWQTAAPASQGVDADGLQKAIDYLRANTGGTGTDEMVIVRNGFLIWRGPSAENAHEICSCTKTFTSTVLGLLAADGKLNLDDRAVSYLPTLDDQYPEYGRIRFRDLASMTSGYDGVMGDGWRFYRADPNRHLEHVLSFTTPGPPMFPAGTSFKYHDPAVHLLGYILIKIARQPLERIVRERIVDPIDMKHFRWSNYGDRDGLLFNNPAGTPGPGQGGIYSNALDLARYGLLYLNQGRWKDRQLLDPNFVAQATSNQVPAELKTQYFDLTGRYGFFWWTNGIRADGTRPWPAAPPRTYAAHGAGRNFIFVVPEWHIVLVRLCPESERDFSSGAVSEALWNAFFTRLHAAIEPPRSR